MSQDSDPVTELDAEYLYPSDADVISISNDEDGGIRVRFVVPDPDTGEGLVLEATVESVEEGDFEFPLDDEIYD